VNQAWQVSDKVSIFFLIHKALFFTVSTGTICEGVPYPGLFLEVFFNSCLVVVWIDNRHVEESLGDLLVVEVDRSFVHSLPDDKPTVCVCGFDLLVEFNENLESVVLHYKQLKINIRPQQQVISIESPISVVVS